MTLPDAAALGGIAASTASESARVADTHDVPVLASLAEAGIEEKRDQRGGAIWRGREARRPPWVESFLADLEADGVLVVVGEYDGVVVGYGVARIEHLGDGRLLSSITDLYVLPDARDVGVGEALVDSLVAWSQDHGACGIDAVALPGDRATKNFFETFGLVARAILVHRSFEAVPDPEVDL